MRRALEATNTTAVLVTHDQNEALSLADQVAVMRGGRLVQSAPPSEVYLSPSDPQVAEFVGRAVVLPGVAAAAHATCALGEVVLTEPTTGPVSLMIRPEQVFVDMAHAQDERLGRPRHGRGRQLLRPRLRRAGPPRRGHRGAGPDVGRPAPRSSATPSASG